MTWVNKHTHTEVMMMMRKKKKKYSREYILKPSKKKNKRSVGCSGKKHKQSHTSRISLPQFLPCVINSKKEQIVAHEGLRLHMLVMWITRSSRPQLFLHIVFTVIQLFPVETPQKTISFVRCYIKTLSAGSQLVLHEHWASVVWSRWHSDALHVSENFLWVLWLRSELSLNDEAWLSFRGLPVVTGDVVDPEWVAHILLPFVFVFAQPRQDVDLVELRVDGGSLGETSHWNWETVKERLMTNICCR